jgi:hypothetical protein
MKRRRFLLSVAVLVSLVAGGGYLARRHAALRSVAVTAAPRAITFALDLPRGTSYAYDVTWTETTDLRVPELAGATIGGGEGIVHADVELAGELFLRSHGKRDGAFLVEAELRRLTRHRVALFGGDALADDAAARDAFDGRAALVEIDAAGAVRAFHYAKTDPPLFKQVMQALLTDAQMHVLADRQSVWTARERTSAGEAEARYEVVDAEALRVARVRERYTAIASLPGRPSIPGEQTLDAQATIDLDPRGLVRAVDAQDTLRVASDYAAKTTLALRLSAVGTWDPPSELDLGAFETRLPGAVVHSAGAEQQMLEQRVAGLTLERMHDDLLAFAVTGALPGGSQWVMRASGLLKLHPERCVDLAALFESHEMNGRGRAQILDLLAGTGTPKAQEAMRIALESRAAHTGDVPYRALLQRFSSVAHPTTESIEFLARAYASAKAGPTPDRYGAAYALGAAAGNARASGDVAGARAAHDILARDLGAARTPAERKHLATALGNAVTPDDVGAFAQLTSDHDEGVRGAAAWALHRVDAPDARAALLGFARDTDAGVAETAFQAMTYQTLGDEELGRLAAVVTAGQTPAAADGALLTLLAKHTDGGAPVRAILGTLLERAEGDNPMLARIRHVLVQVSG